MKEYKLYNNVLLIEEVADLLGIHKNTIHNYSNKGRDFDGIKFPKPRKVGLGKGVLVWARADILTYKKRKAIVYSTIAKT